MTGSGLPLRTCILVLGMHRSGTSAVCGVLSELGAERPLRELAPQPDNPKGFFEPSEIIRIHDRLLESAGAHWVDWDPIPKAWFESAAYHQFVDELADAARHDFPGKGPILLKDPRLCRLIDVWLEVFKRIDCRPVALLQYRDPLEVACSLKSRNDIDIARGLLLWLRHILEAEAGSRGLQRHFSHYSAMLIDWQSELAGLLNDLWPRLPKQSARARNNADAFLDTSLRHHRRTAGPADDLCVWITQTYAALDRLHQDPEDREAMAVLDSVKIEFDRACSAFSPVFFTLSRQIMSHSAEIAHHHAVTHDLNGRLDQATEQTASLLRDLEAARVGLETANRDAETASLMRVELEHAQRSLAELAPVVERNQVLEAQLQGAHAALETTAGEVRAAALLAADLELAPVVERNRALEAELHGARAALDMAAEEARAATLLRADLENANRALERLESVSNVNRSLETDLTDAHRRVAELSPIAERVPQLEKDLASAQDLAASLAKRSPLFQRLLGPSKKV